MMPNHTRALRWMSAPLTMAGGVLLLLASPFPAHAGIIIPELSVVGETGVPGSTVSVTVALTNDTGDAASSADLDLTYPPELLTFFPPVPTNCAIATRLADHYSVGGQLKESTLRLSIFVKGDPPVIPHLGNGPLASCDLYINQGVPAGTAALVIENPGLFDDNGDPLDVDTKNGAVLITHTTPTFTPTVTPTKPPTATVTTTRTPSATATSTGTPKVTSTATKTAPATATPTDTPEVTATSTNTPPKTPTATNTRATPTKTGGGGGGGGGGCDINPIEHSSSGGTLALLLAPAMLIWARRRRL